jgi:hypothetical protein
MPREQVNAYNDYITHVNAYVTGCQLRVPVTQYTSATTWVTDFTTTTATTNNLIWAEYECLNGDWVRIRVHENELFEVPTERQLMDIRQAQEQERRRMEEWRRVAKEQHAELQRKERRASRKALVLLLMVLNPAQREGFRKTQAVHVHGGATGTRYRIRRGGVGNIDVFQGNRVAYRLCAHPANGLPDYDVMAAQALHLQDPRSEREFVAQANRHEVLRQRDELVAAA